MYLGRIVEIGADGGALRAPEPPLHAGAARSVPRLDATQARASQPIAGEIPSPLVRRRAATSIRAARIAMRALPRRGAGAERDRARPPRACHLNDG